MLSTSDNPTIKREKIILDFNVKSSEWQFPVTTFNYRSVAKRMRRYFKLGEIQGILISEQWKTGHAGIDPKLPPFSFVVTYGDPDNYDTAQFQLDTMNNRYILKFV